MAKGLFFLSGEYDMQLEAGSLYFIEDEFFRYIDDPNLMINYDETKRPHYFAVRDIKTGLYWMVPCSSRVKKYEDIIQKRKQQHKTTFGIKIINIQGTRTALLFQNMFPIKEKYISESYYRAGYQVKILDKKVVVDLEKNAKRVINLIRRGIKFLPTQPDALRIEQMMLAEEDV